MISVVYCTREPNPKHSEHIKKTSGLANKIEIIEIVNKGESLTVAYNRGLKQATNDIVVFCHDDILFNSNSWGRKLLNHFKNSEYGILGVAGTTDMNENGQWWADKTKMVGIVKHSNDGKTWESRYSGNFGKEIIETIIVDGLFFAVNKNVIKENFNENVKGFHFYDIDFCFNNYLSGVKIGVIFDVKITHKSIGKTNEEWENNRKQFIEKFKDKLPANIKVLPFIYEKKFKISNEPKVKIITSSSGDKEKTKAFLKSVEDFKYSNYEISLIVDSEYIDIYEEEFKSNNISIYEGNFGLIHKDLSILRWDDDFINAGDELIFFASDNLKFENNVLKRLVSLYIKNKKKFGCGFPRILSNDNTIIATGTEVKAYIDGERQMLSFDLKGFNSYFNYQEGTKIETMGNLEFCFLTTYDNLVQNNWFRLDFEKYFYGVDFATKCSSNNKVNYVDNEAVIKIDFLFNTEENLTQLNTDFGALIKSFNETPKTQRLVKAVRMPSIPQQQPIQ
jgi:hypothetical protein